MSRHTTVALKNDLAELERLSNVVDEFGKRHGLPTTALFDLHLALDEILTNVVAYGYDDQDEHEIIVRLAFGGDGNAQRIEVEVEDDGRPFNPLETASPDVQTSVADRPIGGLGIFLVRRVMEDLEYRRQRGKNVLVMRKTLAG